jgi:hypothetical protein
MAAGGTRSTDHPKHTRLLSALTVMRGDRFICAHAPPAYATTIVGLGPLWLVGLGELMAEVGQRRADLVGWPVVGRWGLDGDQDLSSCP